MKRVLCLLEDGFEEIETVTPVDLLRRAGIEVVIAGVSGKYATGKCGMCLQVDGLLTDIEGVHFDALFLPGGPAVAELRSNDEVISLVRRFHTEGKTIAAICAAPLLLLDAGLVEGLRMTGHFTIKEELPQINGERVVIDGAIITSRGAGTALEFGLTMVGELVGKEIREDISAAVMA
ncbi:MAG: DJ-1 family glyoxalase III [Akkermansiaceae bacterium]